MLSSKSSKDSEVVPQAPRGRQFPRGRRFPQEIFDYIVDYLKEDLAALKICSLVCKDWVPCSSRHLFNELTWPRCTGSPQVLCTAEVKEMPIISSLQHALASSRRLRSAVRSLNIFIHHPECVGQSDPRASPTDDATVSSVLDMLPQVCYLAIIETSFLPEVWPQICLPTRSLDNFVIRLELSLQQHPGPIDYQRLHEYSNVQRLLMFLSSFRRIRTLGISSRVRERAVVPQTPLPHLPLSHRVQVEGLYVDALGLIGPLGIVVDLQSIRALMVSQLSPYPSAALSELSNLENLHYTVDEALPAASFARAFRLHTLMIVGNMRIFPPGREWDSEWDSIVRDLEHLDMSRMRDITLVFGVVETGNGTPLGAERVEECLEAQDWAGLERVVAEQCPALRLLTFKVVHGKKTDSRHCANVFEQVARRRLSAKIVDTLLQFEIG